MVYFWLAPDTSTLGIRAALALSACPIDAIVQADTVTGLVRIETPGVWRADRRGVEEGLGVPGWTLISSEVPGAARDAVEDAKVTVRDKPPIDVRAAQVAKLNR